MLTTCKGLINVLGPRWSYDWPFLWLVQFTAHRTICSIVLYLKGYLCAGGQKQKGGAAAIKCGSVTYEEEKKSAFFFPFFFLQILLSLITSKKSVCVIHPGSIVTPFCSVHCESWLYWTTCPISECLGPVELPVEACILHSVHTIYYSTLSTLCASPLSVHRLGIHM